MRRNRSKPPAIDERPEVREHLHNDSEITAQRVTAFALAPIDVQLLVLGQLQEKAEDQESSFVPTIQSMALAILALLLAVTPEGMRFAVVAEPSDDPLTRWLAVTLGMAIYGVVAAGLVLPVVWAIFKSSRRRTRAAAWLKAYEREISRRRDLPGRDGRSWRRAHPI